MNSNKFNSCCNQNQEKNKSIFNYMTDATRYINNSKNITPFLTSTYIQNTDNINIDLDSELKGMNQTLSKCSK